MDQAVLKEIVLEILETTPSKPFLCLPLSAILYAIIKDNDLAYPQLITGNLIYKQDIIFKQDFSINLVKHEKFTTWAGHAWVEIDGLIIDLSLFRTINSSSFAKPSKPQLLAIFGANNQYLIQTNQEMKGLGLIYQNAELLSDSNATGIIKGMEELLKK